MICPICNTVGVAVTAQPGGPAVQPGVNYDVTYIQPHGPAARPCPASGLRIADRKTQPEPLAVRHGEGVDRRGHNRVESAGGAW